MIKERREHCEKEEARIHELAANGKITEEESAELIHALHRETEYRACPFCSEDVRVEARKCPHCREYLVADVGNLKQRRLYRSRDRMLSGVCGGLANYIGMDPSLVRILVAVVTFFSGILTGLIIYAIMAWIIPEEPVGN
ncbi:MAG: PspC domain-containing protein [Lentisphaeria bacterium]|nr:PspC domain-containing protein [Lentisphaeria bacterium]